MQKEKTEILVRITVNGFVRDYSTTLVTQIPKLSINSIDANRTVNGTLSDPVVSPIGIQSFLGDRSWTLNSGASVKDTSFSASFANMIPSLDVINGTTNILSMNRNTGALRLNA